MTDQSLKIFSLDVSVKLLARDRKAEKFKPSEVSFLSTAYNLFLGYYDVIHKDLSPDPRIESLTSFIELVSLSDLQDISALLSKSSESEGKEPAPKPVKEESSVPSELETMVSLYEQHQADLLDQEKVLPVADTIKRARKAWSEREKHRLVYENASKERQKEIDEQNEKFYRQSINPKAESRTEITNNTRSLAKYLLQTELGSSFSNLSSRDYNEAIERIVYLAETGSIEITNTNEHHLIAALLKRDFLNTKTDYDQIDDLVQERLSTLESDPSSEDIDQQDKEIAFAEQEVEPKFKSHSREYQENFQKNKDYDTLLDLSKQEVNNILVKLQKAVPNAKPQFQSEEDLTGKAAELEALIRKLDPQALHINAEGLGSRTSGVLIQTGGNRKISAPTVDLFSKGLTDEKLRELIRKKDEKGRALVADFLKKNRSVQKRIEFQLKEIQKSKLGKEMEAGIKKVGVINDFIARQSSTVQKILDPVGTTKSYINKRIGQYIGSEIVKKSSSEIAKNIGGYLLSDGLKDGAKKFVSDAARKLALEAAKKAGVTVVGESVTATVALALGIPTAGASLLIGAVLLVGTITIDITIGFFKKGYQEIKNSFGITKEDDKANRKAFLLGLGIIATSALVARSGIKGFATATKAAAISALDIIWLSIATIAAFLTVTFLTAPIITTLVQFDSVEKVKYDKSQVEEATADCNGTTVTNEKATCRGNYCFPVADKSKVSYLTYHHDYKAQDIMRIGDKPGSQDDVPLPIIAYTSGTVVNMDDGTGGLSVYLAGDDGRFYWFTHLSKTTTTGGVQVKAGDIIGCMGTSGNAEGYLEHLHFHIGTKPDLRTIPENYPYFIWPYEDFCRTVGVCGALNPEQYPEIPYLQPITPQ